MAELINGNRVKLRKGQQNKFIRQGAEALGFTHEKLAKFIGITSRTLTDWKREKFLMPLKAAHWLSKKSGVKFPKIIEVRDKYWYTRYGSSRGGLSVIKKYGFVGGNQEYRKKCWYEWWWKIGRFKPHPFINSPRLFRKPKLSKRLAEFVGIILGDGGITQRQITITLHHKDDKEYSKFVVGLIKQLFDVPIGTYYNKKDSVIDYSISRSGLVHFLTTQLGLKQGNKVKQQVDIPDWIKQKKKYIIPCVRGLIDTDGCIFTHKYKVNDKWYAYKKLAFSNRSMPLRQSVFNTLKDLGLHPRMSGDKDVRLDSIDDMKIYFKKIGSHNPKHLKRYYK